MVIVVLACIVLTLVGHALLLLARTGERIVQADAGRVAGSYGVRAALTAAGRSLDSLPGAPGEVSTLATSFGSVRARRVSPEVAILEAGPGFTPGTAAASVVYAPHGETRVRRRGGGLRAGAVRLDAGARLLPGPWCPPVDGAAAAVRWPVRVRPGPVGPGLLAYPGIGVVDATRLLERLEPLPSGELILAAETTPTGHCRPSAANWGDPDRPGGSCATRWGAGGASQSLRLRGAGQGLLVVGGDLTLSADAHFRGWVVVSGEVHLEAGARLEGALDAAGGVRLGPGAVFRPDPCGARDALESSRTFLGVWRIGPSAWPVSGS